MGHRSVSVALILSRESHIIGVSGRRTDGSFHRQVYGVNVTDARILATSNTSVVSVPIRILVLVIVHLRLTGIFAPATFWSTVDWLLVPVVILVRGLEPVSTVETTFMSAGASTSVPPSVVLCIGDATIPVHRMASAGAGPSIIQIVFVINDSVISTLLLRLLVRLHPSWWVSFDVADPRVVVIASGRYSGLLIVFGLVRGTIFDVVVEGVLGVIAVPIGGRYFRGSCGHLQRIRGLVAFIVIAMAATPGTSCQPTLKDALILKWRIGSSVRSSHVSHGMAAALDCHRICFVSVAMLLLVLMLVSLLLVLLLLTIFISALV